MRKTIRAWVLILVFILGLSAGYTLNSTTATQPDYTQEIESLKKDIQDLKAKYEQDEALLRGDIVNIDGMRFQLKDNTLLQLPYTK